MPLKKKSAHSVFHYVNRAPFFPFFGYPSKGKVLQRFREQVIFYWMRLEEAPFPLRMVLFIALNFALGDRYWKKCSVKI